MMDFVETILNPQFIFMALVAVAAFASVMTIALPQMSRDQIDKRMKVMATERDKMRAIRLAELSSEGGRGSLREAPKGNMARFVDKYNLRTLLDAEGMKDKLRMAGLRGQKPLYAFAFFRFVMPIVSFILALGYLFLVNNHELAGIMRLGVALGAGYIGMYLPNIFISNLVSRRQAAVGEFFPDALDLLLICVQSGMSVEAAFAKVSQEVSGQSIELAEEMSLTTAELSYLPERRQAFDNLGKRTGLPMVKAVATSLIQAERYGTPVSEALRVMAKEYRDIRVSEAEKKAAALPPKLTVPMILFFLPVLFIVIIGPAIVRVSRMNIL